MARSSADSRDSHALLASTQALLAVRHKEQAALKTDKALLLRLIDWAWWGIGIDVDDLDAMAELKEQILTISRLFCQPVIRHGEAWPSDETTEDTWAEDLVGLVPSDHPFGKVLLGAAGRWQMMHGRGILPTLLADIVGLDLSRVNDRARKGALAVEPTARAITRPGRRPKGAEKRITAESALAWLVEIGSAPAGSTVQRGKRGTKPREPV